MEPTGWFTLTVAPSLNGSSSSCALAGATLRGQSAVSGDGWNGVDDAEERLDAVSAGEIGRGMFAGDSIGGAQSDVAVADSRVGRIPIPLGTLFTHPHLIYTSTPHSHPRFSSPSPPPHSPGGSTHMLPLPNASRKGRSSPYFTAGAAHHHLSSSQQILATLRSRTRLTNLAATLLVLALSGSLLLNLNFVFFSPRSPRHSPGYPYSYTAGSGWDDAASPEQLESPIPLSIETTLERDPRYAELEHLIMVPGHAIWLGHDANNVEEDDDWILEPMQKGGSVKTYVKHIERGVDELKADPKSLLVFSGYVLLLGRSPRGFQTSVLTECHATKKRRDQTSSLATYPRSSLLLSSSHGAFTHPLDFHLRFSQYVSHPSQLANSHRRICS